jgi:hypothetical protein
MRCVAHTTAGQPCKRKAMVGTTVCYMHNGANAKVVDAADRRLLLAQLMAHNPDRHPWEIIVDATRRFDALAQVEESILLHGDLTPELLVDQLDRYVRALENAHKTAVAAVTTKAADNLSLAVRRRLELESDLLMTATEAMVDALIAYLPPEQADRLRDALLTAGRDRLFCDGTYWEDGTLPKAEPVRLPFRLMLAPAIEGEVVDDNPVIDDHAPDLRNSADVAGVQDARVDLDARRPRLRAIEDLTDDELALEIERRLAEREAAEAVNG